jgi:hypothetical protein
MSKRTIIKNGLTAEDRALNYLIVMDKTFNDSQLLTLNSMIPNAVQLRIRQRYTLLTLWYQQGSTNTRWFYRSGWLVNANECDNWFGISCAFIDFGGTVGTQNVTTAVKLSGNNVYGTIPADIGLLTALTSFDMSSSYNGLTGTLPESIGQWTNLTYFDVSYNYGVNGTIPESIVNWTLIEKAYFNRNNFTGTMPVGICPYIDNAIDERLDADCVSKINCTCCTRCS